MKTVRLHSSNDLREHDEPTPEPQPGEVLVQVRAVGICGSDLHWVEDGGIGSAKVRQPLILGHEFAGVIASGSRLGERVAIDPAIACHTCEYCLEGKPNLCKNIRFAGHEYQDGGLRELIAWPEECLFPLPDKLSFEDAAMLEPLGVAMHSVNLAHLQAGMSVGVFGCGPIGLLVIQMAQLAGALNIYASEPLPHRIEAAGRLGAKEWTNGQEVDVAFEAAGENAAFEDAISAARPGGTVIQIGISGDDQTSFSASVARSKELIIQVIHRMRHTYPRSIQLVETGKVDVRSLVTHQFALDQARQAFDLALRREGLKVIVKI